MPNYSKKTEVETFYTFRFFRHDLYVFNHDRVWQDIGESVSKYYYKAYEVDFYNDKIGEFDHVSYHFSHSNKCDPTVVAKAPNYGCKDKLRDLAYDAWIHNRTYYEYY